MNRIPKIRNIACGISALVIVICANSPPLFAQPDRSLRTQPGADFDEPRSNIQAVDSVVGAGSLDAIRALNEREEANTRIGVPLGVIAFNATSKRELALKKVRQFQASLAGQEDRDKAEAALRYALNEFFLADMQYRIEELDKIKRKVRETEAMLEKRLEAKDKSIELQLKMLFQEADGLSIFSSVAPKAGRRYAQGVHYGSVNQTGQQSANTSR